MKKVKRLTTVGPAPTPSYWKNSDVTLVALKFDIERLGPRLAKMYAKIKKAGRLDVAKLSLDDNWSARFLLQAKAVKAIVKAKTPVKKQSKVKKLATVKRNDQLAKVA